MFHRPLQTRSLSLLHRSYATSHHDVVIIGGGIAGLALGASLSTNKATSHLKTALVEASDLSQIESWTPQSTEWTNRISSVTNDNRRWLESELMFQHLLGVELTFRVA